VIKWADYFDVLIILKGSSEISRSKPWVNSTINESATEARTQSLHCVSKLIMGSHVGNMV
jgi:hypothetical protein